MSVDKTAADGGPRLQDQLCFALYAATHAITRVYRARLGEVGLTYPQYLVLLALMQEEPQTPGGLGRALHLDSGTMTPLIRRLVSAGLASRSRSTVDDRVVEIWLTEKGRALRAVLTTIQHTVVCKTGLEPQEFATLRADLHALTERLSAKDEPAEENRGPEGED